MLSFSEGSLSHTPGCQGRRERKPLGRSKREPVQGKMKQGFSRGKSLWSVAEEALRSASRQKLPEINYLVDPEKVILRHIEVEYCGLVGFAS